MILFLLKNLLGAKIIVISVTRGFLDNLYKADINQGLKEFTFNGKYLLQTFGVIGDI